MNFKQALKEMKEGKKVKLPSWGGYWYWNPEKETVMMRTKDGVTVDIRKTEVVEYTLINVCSDEWIVADSINCPELGGIATFGFDEAVKYLKRGLKVKRACWNAHIELAICISYAGIDGCIKNCDHAKIGNNAIAYVDDSGIQMGWSASQEDMFANDWVFA